MPQPIHTLEQFYGHALAIEREAAARYREFEAYFAARGEAVLAALCAMLARMEADHYAQLARAAEGLAVATSNEEELPESAPRTAFYRITDGEQLLEIALEGEIRAQRFFAWVEATAADETVRALAAGMAQEEARHIRWVTQALAYRRPLRA